MWWFYRKKIDTDEIVQYEYGAATKDVSGCVEYNKKTDKYRIVAVANGDSKQTAERFCFRHLYRLIFKEGSPQERQIACG